MDEKRGFNTTNGTPLANPAAHRSLVGKMLYLTITRPDLAFSIQTLTQYMSNPMEVHLSSAHRLLRYIKATPSLGLFYFANNTFKLQEFCGSDWARCPQTRRNVTVTPSI